MRWVAVGCILLGLSGACGSDVETPGGSGGGGSSSTSTSTGFGGGSPIEVWCGAVVGSFCEALFACCTDAQTLDSFGGSVAACKAQGAQDCAANLQDTVGPLLDSGKSALDEGRLAACVARLDSLASSGAACVEPPRWAYLTMCITAFEGQVAAGEPCVTTPDDLSFVECSHGLCHGVCEPFLKEGQPCVFGSDLCDYTEGLWCVADGASGSCVQRKAIGEPCTELAPGDAEIECLSLACENGVCVVPTGELSCSDAG